MHALIFALNSRDPLRKPDPWYGSLSFTIALSSLWYATNILVAKRFQLALPSWGSKITDMWAQIEHGGPCHSILFACVFWFILKTLDSCIWMGVLSYSTQEPLLMFDVVATNTQILSYFVKSIKCLSLSKLLFKRLEGRITWYIFSEWWRKVKRNIFGFNWWNTFGIEWERYPWF